MGYGMIDVVCQKPPTLLICLYLTEPSRVGQLYLDCICYFVYSATDITPLYIPVSINGLDSVSVVVA
jgi:hypothetical protein